MRFEEFWDKHGWHLVYSTRWPERPEELASWEGVVRSEACRQYLGACFPRGLYRHQVEALRRYGQGEDICLTTGTASGKSAVFYAAAIEGLAQKPWGKVLALYPLKALGREQEERWKNALSAAGFSADLVGRLDGDVPTGMRNEVVRRARVLVATPDIVHAWLLPNVGDPDAWRFVQSVFLFVVDEVHVYTGVFGSNSAFLFRRFGHLAAMANRSPAYLAASATVRDPEGHLRALFGREFVVIGPDWDTSPRYPLDIAMVRPPPARDLMTEVSRFAEYLVTQGSSRFILFVDSRKQTELISAILSRSRGKAAPGTDDEVVLPRMDHLARLDVLPYRAGYEDVDRAAIQERLSLGRLRGVVSTSALELGIDIAHLDVGVLLGVPRSRTNLMQRIGRVGRRAPGIAVIINNGDVHSEAIFRNPSSLFERPLAEGALYLENPRIQYIHAMCLARHGGEHDQVCGRLGLDPDADFASPVPWPEGFMELCLKERTGEVPPDLQSMKMEAGDDPHHVFPLRDVESQFVVEHRRGPDIERMGSLSYGQVMREAYPGAVYYYATTPHRVYQVLPQARVVRVRREKHYTTRPLSLPPMVYPNLSAGNVYGTIRAGDLWLVEANLQIREGMEGFREKRGSQEFSYSYPLDFSKSGVRFSQRYFTRNFFTTGVLLMHPALVRPGVEPALVAEVLYECFLLQIPYERQDIQCGTGVLKVQRGPFPEGTRFVVIYDQTYGSLRLSGRLMEPGVFAKVLEYAAELGNAKEVLTLKEETITCLRELRESAQAPVEKPTTFALSADSGAEVVAPSRMGGVDGSQRFVRVIMPGSYGLDCMRHHEEFAVEAVFFSPREGRVCYRGRHPSDTDPSVTITIPCTSLVEVPGESRTGLYDAETGELIPDGRGR